MLYGTDWSVPEYMIEGAPHILQGITFRAHHGSRLRLPLWATLFKYEMLDSLKDGGAKEITVAFNVAHRGCSSRVSVPFLQCTAGRITSYRKVGKQERRA